VLGSDDGRVLGQASTLIRAKPCIDEDELLVVPRESERVEHAHGAGEMAGIRDAVEDDAGDGALDHGGATELEGTPVEPRRHGHPEERKDCRGDVQDMPLVPRVAGGDAGASNPDSRVRRVVA